MSEQCTCVKDSQMTCIVHPHATVKEKQDLRIEVYSDWLEKCTISEDAPLFVPFDGRCFSCRGDLIDHYHRTGRYSETGCPLCHRSYCD
jgi:hypothetical protein